jgi:hypothetical protein
LKSGNVFHPLDIIDFQPKRSIGIYEEISPLYQSGLSVSDIADQTGYRRTAIWKCLNDQQKLLRPQAPVSFDRWRKGRGKTRARPPYGFCFFDGEVVKNPSEYPTLLLIKKLRGRDLSITAIVEALAKKSFRSRMGKPWSYNVIKAIVGRIENGTIERIEHQISKPNRSKK